MSILATKRARQWYRAFTAPNVDFESIPIHPFTQQECADLMMVALQQCQPSVALVMLAYARSSGWAMTLRPTTWGADPALTIKIEVPGRSDAEYEVTSYVDMPPATATGEGADVS